MKEAEATEREIDKRSEEYLPVAYRASLLFFCIADLAVVDSMYQYSLPWYTNLFIRGIQSATPASELQQRIINLNDCFTYSVYKNVCRSLFEKHKLLLSFLLTIKILEGDKLIDGVEWRFLISGVGPGKTVMDNPDPRWVDSRMWNEICTMDSIPKFQGRETFLAPPSSRIFSV